MKKLDPKHIIISRTDNIGDVILTLPITALLKKHFPNTKISFLARHYVKAIIENCPSVDVFISWDQLNQLPEDKAVAQLQSVQADTIIHVFPHKKIAKLAKRANIATRIGTTNRLYHWLTCNQKVSFSRKKSQLHEAQLNLKLLSPFDIKTECTLKDLHQYVKLRHQNKIPEALKTYLKADKFNLIIHPLSNGNAREWPIKRFNAIINDLPTHPFNILITGSEKESKKLKTPMISQCPNATDLTGKLTLNELLQLIQHADGLVANSTGPLHIAAAMGIKTLGLFPPEASMSPRRWQPIGDQAQHLVTERFCDAKACRNNNPCACMEAIRKQDVQSIILGWLQ